jgi:hypothetical protein
MPPPEQALAVLASEVTSLVHHDNGSGGDEDAYDLTQELTVGQLATFVLGLARAATAPKTAPAAVDSTVRRPSSAVPVRRMFGATFAYAF